MPMILSLYDTYTEKERAAVDNFNLLIHDESNEIACNAFLMDALSGADYIEFCGKEFFGVYKCSVDIRGTRDGYTARLIIEGKCDGALYRYNVDLSENDTVSFYRFIDTDGTAEEYKTFSVYTIETF